MAMRYNKKHIVLFTLMFMVGLFIFGTLGVALGTGSANIEITVKGDDAKAYTGDLSSGINVVDSTGNVVSNTVYKDLTNGKYTISGLTTDGDYYVSLGDGKVSQTIKVAGYKTTPLTPAKTGSMVWSTNGGAIGGVTYKANGTTALAGVKVKIFNSKAAWITTSSANGSFWVMLPIGTYNMIVYGTNPTLYRNNIYSLTVSKGQLSSPLDILTGEDAWTLNEEKLGLTFTSPTSIDGILNTTKEITGTVNKDAIVSVSVYDAVYAPTLLTTAKPSATDGKYKVTLNKVQPGKRLIFKVVDSAENVYTTIMAAPIAKLDPILSTSEIDADYNKDVTINFTDVNNFMTKDTTTVTVSVYNGAYLNTLDLTKSTLTAGSKLIIKAGVLDVGDYTVKLANSSFIDAKSSVHVKIGASTSVVAPALTVTAVAYSTGSYGDTKLTVTNLGSGNSIRYKKSNVTIPTPKVGDNSNAIKGIQDLASNSVVSVVDIVYNKYLAVYETTNNDAVVKFTVLTLDAPKVKLDLSAPSITGTVIDSTYKIVTITTADFVYQAGTDIKASIKLLKDGSTLSPLVTNDTVVISGKTIVVTFDTALTSITNKIQIVANSIQSKYGAKNTSALTSGVLSGAILNSTISPATATFDKKTAAQLDKTVALTLNGNVLSSVYNGSSQLTPTTDYTVTGTNVLIKKTYLAKQSVGTTTLTFKFNAGTNATQDITVSDTTPASNSTIAPTTATFDKKTSAQADKLVTLTLLGNVFGSVYNGSSPLILDTDYTVGGGGTTVTISKTYLAKQSVGTTTLTFKFSAGLDKTLPITVSNTTASIALTGVGVNVLTGNITGTVTGMVYSLNSTDGVDGTWADASATNTPVTFLAGNVYVRQADLTSNKRLVATIAPAASAPTSGVAYSVYAGTVTPLGATFEYSINGGAYSSTATGVTFAAGPVRVRVKATATVLPSAAETIGTISAQAAAPAGIGVIAGIGIGGTTTAMEYRVNSEAWKACTASPTSDITLASGQTVDVRIKATGSTLASLMNTTVLP